MKVGGKRFVPGVDVKNYTRIFGVEATAFFVDLRSAAY